MRLCRSVSFRALFNVGSRRGGGYNAIICRLMIITYVALALARSRYLHAGIHFLIICRLAVETCRSGLDSVFAVLREYLSHAGLVFATFAPLTDSFHLQAPLTNQAGEVLRQTTDSQPQLLLLPTRTL